MRRASRRLKLQYRQIRLAGDWHTEDATDQTAVLRKIAHPHDELWLLDAERVVLRRAFAGAVTPHSGWWIGGVEVSDSWIAWEEVAPGDDLVEEVQWRLYAAPLDRTSLTVGEPRLVRSALNTEVQRPLFDISGQRLVWLDTTWASRGTVGVSRLLVRLLDAEDEPRELYRSQHGMLIAVSTRGAKVIVTEVPKKRSLRTRILLVGLSDGMSRAAYSVPSRYGLSHWPAWRKGELAWSPFENGESAVPTTFLRARTGRVYRTERYAADPLFVGPYLFYETGFGRNGIRAVRTRDMKSFILIERDRSSAEISWGGACGAPGLRHTYYTYCYCPGKLRTMDDNYSLIRIYRVP